MTYRENTTNHLQISGSTLKIIALISMLIDHVGAGIVEWYVQQPELAAQTVTSLNSLDMVLRAIGRIAFPIYCFLLTEGYLHTHNAWKYLARLAVFAVVSEVPFDLCFFKTVYYPEYQNVFITLALGVLLMICFGYIERWQPRLPLALATFVKCLLYLVSLMAVCLAAECIKCDYMSYGILTICVVYLCRRGMRTTDKRYMTLVALGLSCLLILGELPALLSLIPVALYNGRRGLKFKYLFYVFYPGHLLVLWLIGRLIFGV